MQLAQLFRDAPDTDAARLIPLREVWQTMEAYRVNARARSLPSIFGRCDVRVVDDSNAIQKALDDYPSLHRIIYSPIGTYLVSQ